MSALEQLSLQLNTDYQIGMTILPNSNRHALRLPMKGSVVITVIPHPNHSGLELYLHEYIEQYKSEHLDMEEYTMGDRLARCISREIVRYFHHQIASLITSP